MDDIEVDLQAAKQKLAAINARLEAGGFQEPGMGRGAPQRMDPTKRSLLEQKMHLTNYLNALQQEAQLRGGGNGEER